MEPIYRKVKCSERLPEYFLLPDQPKGEEVIASTCYFTNLGLLIFANEEDNGWHTFSKNHLKPVWWFEEISPSQPEIVYPEKIAENESALYLLPKTFIEGYNKAIEDFKSLNQNRTSVQVLASTDTDNWVKVETPPEYEKDYLCFVEITQECGTIWERQQVLHFSFFPDEIDKEHPYGTRRFNTDKDVRVIKWQELPQPPLTDK